MRFLVPFIVALGTLAGPALAQIAKPADADGTSVWRNIGGWEVGVERARGTHVCYVVSLLRGAKIRLGYSPSRAFDVILINDAWKSLEPGKDYAMTIHIDDRQHPGTMRARRIHDGTVILERTVADAAAARQFLQDFQRGARLTVVYDGRQLAAYTLQASNAAGEELTRCQTAQDSRTPPPAAAKPVAPDEDPFKPRTGTGGSGETQQKRRD